MKTLKSILKIMLLLILLLALSACGSDLAAELQEGQAVAEEAAPTENPNAPFFTQAVETVNAKLTQTALSFSPTPLPVTSTPIPEATVTLIQLDANPTQDPALPTFTPLVGIPTLVPTATQITTINTVEGPICDSMTYDISTLDQNYPDGSAVPAGHDFEKIWRIRNSGICTWDEGYVLVPVGVESTRANDLNPLDAVNPTFEIKTNVEPGQNVDVGAKLTAPLDNGTYATHFRMMNDRGSYFGGVITVIIKVTDGK